MFGDFKYHPEILKYIRIEYFMTLGFVTSLNKGILLRHAQLVKFELIRSVFAVNQLMHEAYPMN